MDNITINKAIQYKMNHVAVLEAQLCKAASAACLLMDDSDAAHDVLQSTRDHLNSIKEEEDMFNADTYLTYVSSILTLAKNLGNQSHPLTREILESFKFFKKNKSNLQSTLTYMKGQKDLQAKRENYWKN